MGGQHILRAGRHHGASGPVGPASVSPALWLKADAGTTTTTDGQPVSTWSDQSGHSRHLTQTGTARPTYKAAILSGGTLPVVRFDGVDDFMSYLGGADWITGTGLSVFTARVIRAAVPNTGALAFIENGAADDYAGTSSALIGFEGGGNSILQDYHAGSPRAATPYPGLNTVFHDGSVWDASNDLRYLDGTSFTPIATTGGFAIRNLYLGCRYTGSTQAFFGQADWGEMLVYDSTLGSTDISAVFSYLGRWSA